MRDAIVADKTMVFAVIDNNTGFYTGLERTPAQAIQALSLCLDDEDVASRKLYVDDPDTPEANDGMVNKILDCVNKTCLDELMWEPIISETGTN